MTVVRLIFNTRAVSRMPLPLTHVQGVTAIHSLEMALQPGMRGRDRQVFDNLEAVEVRFLSP
jgi:hypothetical protein